MKAQKITIDIDGVQKTLVLPLYARAKFSQIPNPLIIDQQAIQLMQKIDYDFESALKQCGDYGALGMVARAYHFDNAIRHYLNEHPKAVIVNLGAGLDTTFERVDNGQLTWIDLDLPDVINLRNILLTPHPRVHVVAKSILDFSWITDIRQFGTEYLFIAGGLFMYLKETEVKSLLITMGDQFSQSELIFNAISKKFIKLNNQMLKKSKFTNAYSYWGLDEINELENWSSRIKIRAHYKPFDTINVSKHFSLLICLKVWLINFLLRPDIIIHLKLGSNTEENIL